MAESSAPRKLWEPGERAVEEAQVTQFARQVVRKRRLELNSYADFYRWSVERPEEFWSDTWDFCGVRASRKGSTVLVDGEKMPGARWFPEARLNLAENLMRRGDRGDAFVFWDESGLRRRVSYADLYSDVSRAAQALTALGLRSGERVAAFIPNMPEAGMLALAALSQGMVWSSCSPDFGAEGVLERFGQIEPKVLFCADGYRYNGETHDSLARVAQMVEKLPSVRKVVVVPHLDARVDVSEVPKAVVLDEWLRRYTPGEIAFAQLPFDHPVFILFSSCTSTCGRASATSTTAPPTGWCGTCSSRRSRRKRA
jgi:acetoacetyl-CoA synthetase